MGTEDDLQRVDEDREEAARLQRVDSMVIDLVALSPADRDLLVERLPHEHAEGLLRVAARRRVGGPLFFLGLARDSLVRWQTGDREKWTLSFEVEDVMRRVGAETTVSEGRAAE